VVSEVTSVRGKEILSYCYPNIGEALNGLLMVTPFSKSPKYLEIKRSLKA